MAKEKLTIYIKPTCTTCRKALKILNESNEDFKNIDYFEKPLTSKTLTRLIKKLGTPPRELLRKNSPVYKEFGLSKKELTDSEIIDLMIENPDLLQRPIVVKGEKVVLARPADKILDLFK